MKLSFKKQCAPVFIALVAVFGLVLAGCSQPTGGNSNQPGGENTPVASDFNIGTLQVEYDGSPKAVSITNKAGKSQGGITVWYTGTDGTTYSKNKTAPSAVGKYAVTFDVAAHEGYEAVTLSAGTLVISAGNGGGGGDPITEPHFIVDFEDAVWNATGYAQRTLSWQEYSWTVSGVVNPDDNDRYKGAKSIRLRGNDGDTCRIELDSYLAEIKAIHFDYASYSSHANGTIILYYQVKNGAWTKAGEVTAEGWGGEMATVEFNINKEDVRFKIVREGDLANFTSVNIDNIVVIGGGEGFSTIEPVDPVASDFNINGLEEYFDGTRKSVSITPKGGKSQGAITVWYTGIAPTTYARSNTAPSAAGKYAVTFDVAAANGFNAKTGLSAGTLEITEISGSHFIVNFEDAAWNGGAYAARDVTWDGKDWRVSGVVNPDENDRYVDAKSIRLRGNAGDNCYVELVTSLPSIKTISFDYASYSTHDGGEIVLYTQVTGGTWIEAGRVDPPTWSGALLKSTTFNINKSNVRFKIVREGGLANRTTVNVDNIVVTY